MTQQCRACGLILPISEFPPCSIRKSGVDTRCSACTKAYRSALRESRQAGASHEQLIAEGVEKTCGACGATKKASGFYFRPERSMRLDSWCIECRLSYSRDKSKTDEYASRKKVYTRKARLKTYGISISDYEGMLSSQGGVCAICGEKKTQTGKTNMHVDHDHATGEVRGILCSSCNTALGGFMDSRDLLDKAIEYLDLPPARRLSGTSTISEEAA